MMATVEEERDGDIDGEGGERQRGGESQVDGGNEVEADGVVAASKKRVRESWQPDDAQVKML
jgi:hypothetical protein